MAEREVFVDAVGEIERLRKAVRELSADAHQMAAFLDSDRQAGEKHWKSPYIMRGSDIDKLIEKYEGVSRAS